MRDIVAIDISTGTLYKRIHKNSVKRYLSEGKDVVMQACKLDPFGIMGHSTLFANDYKINKNSWITSVLYFEAICCDYERGYYPSFYVEM